MYPTPAPDPGWIIAVLVANRQVSRHYYILVLHLDSMVVAAFIVAAGIAVLALLWLHRREMLR